ncbi:hypothetical protein [Bifidobacterium cuniculi]|uniref:Putative DoxX n=1 Tax=Bifidobacterium cuniculi TaxID=1688 RepID=A0A087B421_9BIFI|nr:hypothetical protein [Bifidobacterium cuniculi]KFI65771.1 putative DoxX [Bifidobacterium cuniculi]
MSQEALDHIIQTVDDSDQPLPDNLTIEPYRPVFNSTVRTVIYVVCLVAGIVGLGFTIFGDAAIGSYVATAAAMLAGGFGVAYNPVREGLQ